MVKCGILLVLTLVAQSFFAHRGDYLAIEDVEITESHDDYVYSFVIENIKLKPYTGVRIEFWINGETEGIKIYDYIDASQQFILERFVVPKHKLDLENDHVNIEITEIFGKKNDWGGWDSPNQKEKQVNTLYSEFYVDAPWRMPKYDDLGELNDVPLHFYLHDADLVVGTTVQIDMIDVKIKNASDNSFGNVLTFDSLSASEFETLFSCSSQNDNSFSIQGFDLTSFVSSSSTTIDFNQSSDFWNDYVEVDATYWFFTFNLPAEVLVGFQDVIDVQITIHYGNLTFSDDVIGLRIFRSSENIPSLPDFYRGDTHLHSIYTQNDAETGLPLCGTKEAARLIGLDWITTTDHTSDFDNYGTTVAANWDRIKQEAQQLNQSDQSLIYIPGQEVALNNHDDKLVHMLAYPDHANVYSLPFLGDGDGDVTPTGVSINSALNNLYLSGGFAYAAHPFATEDRLPTIPVDGYLWNLGDDGFPDNSGVFPSTGGSIICNDIGAPSDVYSSDAGKLIKDGLAGAQIWNVRNNLESTGDELDPWDVDNGGGGFSVVDTASFGYHIKRFRQGQEVVNYINQLGLRLKTENDSLENWKMFFSAGADAHGSFNFSNTDDFAGFGTINDNAVGKVNTVVYCPEGMKVDGSGVLEALRNGRASLSDGPIISIGISDDGNNNSSELLMGSDSEVDIAFLGDYFLNADFVTSQEFGEVDTIVLIVGTQSGEFTLGVDTSWYQSGVVNKQISLEDAITSAMGLAEVPQDEYIYIRAELRTFKDLSSVAGVHKTSYQYHHSFTNPIWLKFKEVTAEVDFLTLQGLPNPFDEQLSLTIKTNEPEDVVIQFFDELGRIVYSREVYVYYKETIVLTENELPIAPSGYFVRAKTSDETVVERLIKVNY
ncbi:T9SS type A sorting domain-containing protein [Parvicella tangerina]|uniref:T9SS C-terminal target domain-containing protein n=1 Tax=Parvicella tangerina TaxID=2829795 RepID=A0A916JLB4_9FLAO|nr:T9SS type A sorting domain-containing protein [Parvicella tangerina]CAG5078681.1 hypothetical protein CRYO30217_00739 [Parvicella tangerina]